jgi:glutathione S-transferase
MPDLRIYGIARTRAFRALWIAKELGLDYEHIPIEIGPAGARKAEYLAINPNGRLPAIDDGGFVLWESLAITLYLAKKHGRLYPATLEGEAKAWQWSLLSVQEVDRGVNIWSLHAVRLPPEDRDPQRLAEALKVLEPPFKVLEAALADAPTCWATRSPSPISTLPPSSAGPSTWTCRRCRASATGSTVASNVRRHAPRGRCGRRLTPRCRSR